MPFSALEVQPSSSFTAPFFSKSTYVLTEGCLKELCRNAVPHGYTMENTKILAERKTLPRKEPLLHFGDPLDDKFTKNVVIIVIDSLSRAEIMAYLPRVRHFLTNLHSSSAHGKRMFPFLNALSLDGTTSYAFSALLSGQEFILKPNNHRVWLQDELKEEGYATKYFGDVWPIAVSFKHVHPVALKYLLEGGELTNATEFDLINHLRKCGTALCNNNGVDEVSHQAKHLGQFWQEHRNSSKFAILHFVSAHTPNDGISISLYDKQLTSLLHGLVHSPNTSIFFLTDHGRMQDEHSFGFPMVAAILSETELNQEREEKMMWNSGRMVTMYDLYHTIRHLLLSDKDVESVFGTKQKFQRSMLASKIAENRTCDGAGIPPSVCPCLARSWEKLSGETAQVTSLEIEKIIRAKQHVGCAPYIISRIDIRKPRLQTQRQLGVGKPVGIMVEKFIRAEIYVQENVTFQMRGYGTEFIFDLRQTTSYKRFEKCTPKGADPEFCICPY